MKLSLYTYLFERGDVCYVYNSQTGLFSSIVRPVYESLYNHDFDNIDKEILNVLVQKHIVVEDDRLYDYYHLSRQRFLRSIGEGDSLDLVIAPTTDCNFACPYCFEGQKAHKYMSPAVVDSLICFIKNYKNVSYTSLTWYGGEPLLAFYIMKEVVARIKKECKTRLKFQSIITNGFLINEHVIEFLNENKFKSVQITLDGVEKNHDRTRCLKGSGKPTYQTILTNVEKLLKGTSEKLRISVRININRDNEENFAVIHKKLKEKYPQRRLSVYPGFIRESNSDGSRMCYKSLIWKSKYEFYKTLEAQGFNVDFYPHRRNKGCMISKGNSYVIGPEGEMYKCWNDFNNPERVIGNIKDKKLSNPSLIDRYSLETTIYGDTECKECMLFPVCDGGCGWYRYQNVFNGKKYNFCPYLKNLSCLEDCLLEKGPKEKDDIKVW